jgi:hypothetical protein
MNTFFQMALNLWNSTGNVQTWLHKYAQTSAWYAASPDKIELSSKIETKNGLNSKLADKICAFTFKRDIALISFDVTDQRVLEVGKQRKVTFSEMLGTVGKSQDLEAM